MGGNHNAKGGWSFGGHYNATCISLVQEFNFNLGKVGGFQKPTSVTTMYERILRATTDIFFMKDVNEKEGKGNSIMLEHVNSKAEGFFQHKFKACMFSYVDNLQEWFTKLNF